LEGLVLIIIIISITATAVDLMQSIWRELREAERDWGGVEEFERILCAIFPLLRAYSKTWS